MIARIQILSPNPFLLPDGKIYSLHAEEYDKYVTIVRPPMVSVDTGESNIHGIELNGSPAFIGKVLVIDFISDTFDRSAGSACDPPLDVIKEVANRFLRRARYVANSGVVKEMDFPECPWRLEYLNDDGSELEQEKGLVRGRGILKLNFSWIALDEFAWNSTFDLGPYFEPPAWHSLLLDASEQLPQVGPSLAIAGTALEVFIASVLNGLAQHNHFPEPWWKWINDRGNYLKEPSVEEQFGPILQLLCGHSAKELGPLWESFVHLKTARNKFVHTGIATLKGNPVTTDQARQWIADSWKLLEQIRTWLPDELKWPQVTHPDRTVSVVMAISQGQKDSGDAEVNDSNSNQAQPGLEN